MQLIVMPNSSESTYDVLSKVRKGKPQCVSPGRHDLHQGRLSLPAGNAKEGTLRI